MTHVQSNDMRAEASRSDLVPCGTTTSHERDRAAGAAPQEASVPLWSGNVQTRSAGQTEGKGDAVRKSMDAYKKAR